MIECCTFIELKIVEYHGGPQVAYKINGFRIIDGLEMVTTKEVHVARSWKERLFETPWRPFDRYNIKKTERIKNYAIICDGKLRMHPILHEKIILLNEITKAKNRVREIDGLLNA